MTRRRPPELLSAERLSGAVCRAISTLCGLASRHLETRAGRLLGARVAEQRRDVVIRKDETAMRTKSCYLVVGLLASSIIANMSLLLRYREMCRDSTNALVATAWSVRDYLRVPETYIESALAGTLTSKAKLAEAVTYLQAAEDSMEVLKYLDSENASQWHDIQMAVGRAVDIVSFLDVPSEWETLPSNAVDMLDATVSLLEDVEEALPDSVSRGQNPNVAFDANLLESAQVSAPAYLDVSGPWWRTLLE